MWKLETAQYGTTYSLELQIYNYFDVPFHGSDNTHIHDRILKELAGEEGVDDLQHLVKRTEEEQ